MARLGDGWHASSTNHEAFRQGAETVARFWREAGRDGAPILSLRVPLMIDGVHRPAVDMSLLRGRYAIQGSVADVVQALKGFQALGLSHVALEASYTTYPAILETIDLLAAEVRPAVSG